MLAVKPRATASVLPSAALVREDEPRLDFRAVPFHAPSCQTRPVAHAPDPVRNDHDLIVRLCQMPVDLAAPLLRSSLPSLDAAALLALIALTGEAHHLLIAQRPMLDWRVVRALLKSGHDSVLVALVRNPAAELDEADRARLDRLAQERPDLRQALSERFRRSAPVVDDLTHTNHSNLKLLKLLRNGEAAAFTREAARRLKLEPSRLETLLVSSSAVPFALTLCALGFDRAVFAHLFPFWQAAHDGEPRVADKTRPVLLSVFALTPDQARQKLTA